MRISIQGWTVLLVTLLGLQPVLIWLSVSGIANARPGGRARKAPANLAPMNLKIQFKSHNQEELLARYGADFSLDGVLIRTREPLPVGTRMLLDLQYYDGTPLLSGEGAVA